MSSYVQIFKLETLEPFLPLKLLKIPEIINYQNSCRLSFCYLKVLMKLNLKFVFCGLIVKDFATSPH